MQEPEYFAENTLLKKSPHIALPRTSHRSPINTVGLSVVVCRLFPITPQLLAGLAGVAGAVDVAEVVVKPLTAVPSAGGSHRRLPQPERALDCYICLHICVVLIFLGCGCQPDTCCIAVCLEWVSTDPSMAHAAFAGCEFGPFHTLVQKWYF